ncbi:transcription factor GTE12-like [Olea europaea var. sylvestris]|uniref:transcription factor GTE12-like n=1 Tax=Olea europaea var. sylvestris TaxID=158386 RepID=UPI000C1CE19A|nr:transcription factor GTE12-like [Olea europaea var. sylvestris]
MAADTVKRSIKFKITSKGIRHESEEKSCENMMGMVNNECRQGVTANGKSTSGNSNKRKPGVILECRREKKQRMEQSFKKQCGIILRLLMGHPHGFAFNQPVDPVKLKIPDYFSIITKPMDLGTIKSKLEGNKYLDVEEFASDVRLTFSNAMLYNPPGNFVHNFAKELNDLFCSRWKLLETKMKSTGGNLEQLCILEGTEKNGQDTKPILEKKGQNATLSCLDKASVRISLVNRGPLSLEEKKNLRKELVKISSGKMTTARTRKSGCPVLVKTVHKDNGNRSAFAAANRKQPFDSPAVECTTCGSLMCHCSLRRCSVKPSSSERSSHRDLCGESKTDRGVKDVVPSHTRGLKQDSDGHERVLDEDNFQQSGSSPASAAAIDEGWTSLVHMSPNKALRAAMLKSRFSDTIFRAKHQNLLDHHNKINPVNRLKERERLERQQREDKAKIEAEIRAAEAASRMRVEADLNMQHKRAREAARIAIEKMVKTVDIDENREVLEDLEAIMGAISGGNLRNPLEKLGLYLKDDYVEEEDEAAILQGEEGEILP